VAESRSHRKSASRLCEAVSVRFSSTRLARNGPWKELEVRESRTNTLKSANDTAMRRVRTPAMRTEYARVPIRWMMKVRTQITAS